MTTPARGAEWRTYGQWAGDPKGRAEDKARCVEAIYGELGCHGGRQCFRKRGHGLNGEYCKQHARPMSDEKARAIHAAKCLAERIWKERTPNTTLAEASLVVMSEALEATAAELRAARERIGELGAGYGWNEAIDAAKALAKECVAEARTRRKTAETEPKYTAHDMWGVQEACAGFIHDRIAARRKEQGNG